MRIIIESGEPEPGRSGVQSPVAAAAPPAADEGQALNGGSPSDALVAALSASGASDERGSASADIGGGAPPEWLLEALQRSEQAYTPRDADDIDAGSAPGED